MIEQEWPRHVAPVVIEILNQNIGIMMEHLPRNMLIYRTAVRQQIWDEYREEK